MFVQYVSTPIGLVEICSDGGAITRLRPVQIRAEDHPDQWTVLAANQLTAYFSGSRTGFSLPLSLCGTAFEQRVWSALCHVPYGATVSYGRLAAEIGCPGAARAVGKAVGKNPILILVPCHRVLPANGSLGGFSAGIEKKRFLLSLEQKNQP